VQFNIHIVSYCSVVGLILTMFLGRSLIHPNCHHNAASRTSPFPHRLTVGVSIPAKPHKILLYRTDAGCQSQRTKTKSDQWIHLPLPVTMDCLNTLLPPKKTTDYVLRNSDTSYVPPQCSLNVFKRSFCLSNAMYSSIGQNIKSLACPMSDV